MELASVVSLSEVENELRLAPANRLFVQVKVGGAIIRDLRCIGGKYWFDYHCNESHASSDAVLWYHSHQECTILNLMGDDVAFTTFRERGEAGHQILYRVRFADGFQWDVFEDELLDGKDQFSRPDPPDSPPVQERE